MNDRARPVWSGELGDTILGELWVARSEAGLAAVSLWGDKTKFSEQVFRLTRRQPDYEPEKVSTILQQLQEYLNGQRKRFSVPIDWTVMTPFQQEVLQLVCHIEYGRTCTYGEIAQQLGKPNAMRAVGRANATNPMPIIVPCHRVLGSDGRLHGYTAPGGVETKARLLRLEGSWLI